MTSHEDQLEMALAPLSPSTTDSPNWFAVYTSPRHEKAVSRHFQVRQIESFLPVYSETHFWKNGCRVQVEQPLFPSYVFARVERRQCVRLLSVPGVVSLVGCGHLPSAVSDFEIESLRSGLHLRRYEPYAELVAGRQVRIKAGALIGMTGVLLRRKTNLRVVLTLNLIMRSVAVEVGIDELELIRNQN